MCVNGILRSSIIIVVIVLVEVLNLKTSTQLSTGTTSTGIICIYLFIMYWGWSLFIVHARIAHVGKLHRAQRNYVRVKQKSTREDPHTR